MSQRQPGQKQDPPERATAEWIKDMAQARRNVREWLLTCEQEGVPPNTIVCTSTMAADQAVALRSLHAVMQDFVPLHEPWAFRFEQPMDSDDYPGAWQRPLGEITPPEFIDADDLPATTIRLSNFTEWASATAVKQSEKQGFFGNTQADETTFRLYVPTRICRRGYNQLLKIQRELGLAGQTRKRLPGADSRHGYEEVEQ